MEYSAKLYRSAPHPGLQDRLQISVYFAKDRFPVKEQFYIYDDATFLSDFGAYLGLLLGYSILTFYEMLFDLFEYVSRKCNNTSEKDTKKRPRSGVKQNKTRPESGINTKQDEATNEKSGVRGN